MPGASAIYVLAQDAPRPPAHSSKEREKVRDAAGLTVIAVLLIMLLGGGALIMLARHRRRVYGSGSRRRGKDAKPTDAWSESAKRTEIPPDGSRDDTVDIDPDELGPQD